MERFWVDFKLGTQVRRYAGTQVRRYAGTQVRRYAGTQVRRYAGVLCLVQIICQDNTYIYP
ncbi:hypothetical protein [Moraxella cuniculi]|uniref:hypothetical protein n=1 Tax=Moraxella cuniculi TaxID=34061 RepID=UPI0013565278|nr:hypothetical protein [Moraxella cuniculi]